MRYFCIPDFPDGFFMELELEFDEEPLLDPTVPELYPFTFAASNTDMPCGPIVITTGSPSGDLP